MSDKRAPAERIPSTSRPRNNRAAVSNGRLLPRGIDGRSAAGRRWKDLYRDFSSQLPAGPPMPGRDARLRALVGVSVAIERITAQQAAGRPVDHTELVSLVNAQGRMLSELGLGPKSEPDPGVAGPALDDFLEKAPKS